MDAVLFGFTMADAAPWIAFNLFVLFMLALDLGVFHRHAHEVRIREALAWSVFWIVLALAFAVGIYFHPNRGKEAALNFLMGYVVEKALSVDNLFVFLLIFSFFQVPRVYQHKVLFWGIIGALIMRATFIILGAALISMFHWIMYIFGALLIYTGMKLCTHSEPEIHPEKNPVLRLFRRWFPVAADYHGGQFFVRISGRLMATPLFVVLLLVETTDVVFAVDSIPAIFGITKDPFIVYTSNVFAILGLRALYFALAGLMQLFRFLNFGLAFILVFIGAKMIYSEFTHQKIPEELSLLVVLGVLSLSVFMSILIPERSNGETEDQPPPPGETEAPAPAEKSH